VSQGFTICTHPNKTPKEQVREGQTLEERTEEDPSPGWTGVIDVM